MKKILRQVFCENNLYNYLEPYIVNKLKKKIFISFEPIKNINNDKITIFIFRNNFIELVFLT